MTLIPHFVQNELEAGDTAARASAFNFCDPFDHVLPIADGSMSAVDRAQLWGLYSGISSSSAPVFSGTIADISVVENTGTYNYDLSTYFTGATSYSISPAVETGWTFDTGTGILTIDTDDASTFGPYTITGTNAGGTDDSNAFGIEVTAVAVAAEVTGGSGDNTAAKRRKKRREVEIPTAAEVFKEKILALREPLPAPLEGLDEPILADTAPLVTIESPVDREIAKLLRLDEIKQVQADRKALAVEHERLNREILKARREEESELLLLYLAAI